MCLNQGKIFITKPYSVDTYKNYLKTLPQYIYPSSTSKTNGIIQGSQKTKPLLTEMIDQLLVKFSVI